KIQQAIAQVITFTIEHAVDLLLEKVFDRSCDHHDRRHREDSYDDAQRDLTRSECLIGAEGIQTAGVNNYGDEQRNGESRECVNENSSHHQLDVHQAIAKN